MEDIIYRLGDATRPEGPGIKLIAHVCNDRGAWGKGFVLALSRRWAEPEARYRAWQRGGESMPFVLGQAQFVQVGPDIWVANMIGQHGIRSRGGTPPLRYDALREALRRVADQARRLPASVHMPRIGAGLAGGRWEEIALIIREKLVDQGIEATVYDLAP